MKIRAFCLISLVGIGILSLISLPASAADRLLGFQTPTPLPGNVLFQDDFATYSNRWSLQDSPKAVTLYRDAALHMRVISPGVSIWSLPDFEVDLKDYGVTVTVQIAEGSPDSMFGFVFNYRNDENFYALVVSTEGTWQFLRRDKAAWIDLTPADAKSIGEILSDSTIYLQAEAVDNSFTLYVNGMSSGQVFDDTLTSGQFGLIAMAGKGYIDVSFDNVIMIDIR